MSKLAILGGTPAVSAVDPTIFKWPIVTPEMESAVLKVLHDGSMSGIDITQEFEAGYAAWHQCRYALAHSSGTAALHSAMYGIGLGAGDELICPSITYYLLHPGLAGRQGRLRRHRGGLSASSSFRGAHHPR